MYDEYDISVLACNDVGDAPSPTIMIGYSGEDGQCLVLFEVHHFSFLSNCYCL